MTTQSPITEDTPKKKQAQPRHHAPKSKQAVELRRKKIISAITAGKTNRQAGIDSGLSPKTAAAQVTAILKDPETQITLRAAMEKIGITDEEIARQHKLLLDGSRYLPARGDQAENQDAPRYIAVPDLQAKAKALEMYHKLTGSYVDKHEVDVRQPIKVIIRKFCSRGTPSAEGAPA
jgi:hypothetical protein